MSRMDPCLDASGRPKRRYYSEAEALEMAAFLRRTHGASLRAYTCPTCRGWHLTKQAEGGRAIGWL